MSETPVHLRNRRSNYDRFPSVPGGDENECTIGWPAICDRLTQTGARIFVIEASPGVHARNLEELARSLSPAAAIDVAEALKPESDIDALVAADVTDDPVFGKLTHLRLDDFFDETKLKELQRSVETAAGRVVVYGAGASLVSMQGVLVYADVSRWETTLRLRRGEFANLGASNAGDSVRARYKRAWFVDWRVADRRKKDLFDDMDFVLDLNDDPKMISADAMQRALAAAARRPFRLVPYFDPAPWGGQWMKKVCGLDESVDNFGWCFDCVPEENSLLLAFGEKRFEIPSMNLIWRHAEEVLGEAVYGRFGDEFPIRFDFLDTVEGSNLSLQVHPLTEYAHDQFGLHYTQDESYYLLDAEPDASVYLGVKQGVDREAMLRDLRDAELGESSFDAEKYVNRFPAKRHDHFLIPAGTIHCSSRCMVLEISATPYIFTFKLWDWDRPGLDGLPRPVHVDHGANVIRWERDTAYAQQRLINQVTKIAEGDGWLEERTGLHEAEFIETRRRWFTKTAPHGGHGGVSVLNLVEGEEAIVESPRGSFEPFVVHYAETFVVPAAAGTFTMRPAADGVRCGTVEAFVRTKA
ncbi:MAG: class I mannose-6-phosphate isomerase [Actinomycetota bacterium]|nr:class I mannose-6-phosphate isomerase [Actinomycetota bacterium]